MNAGLRAALCPAVARAAAFIAALVPAALLTSPDGAAETAARITVWSSISAETIDEEQLRQAITSADYLVIGEIHDNPLHHQLQADLLSHFADHDDGQISVGFEQLSVDQQPLLDAFYQQANATADTFAEAVEWSQSGWPDYGIYQVLFTATLERQLAIVPLMFSAATTREVFNGGVDVALTDDALSRLRPDALLSAEQRDVVERDMQDAHCGKLPESMLPGMVDVQIARDAFMAYRMVQAAERGVIITGNGHARRDRGMPLFMARLRPDANILVINLLELADVEGDALAGQAQDRADNSISDYTVFTPELARSDPCLAFQ